MKRVKGYTLTSKILLSLGCLPIIIEAAFRLFPSENTPYVYKNNTEGYFLFIISLLTYIVVATIISKRTIKYFFTSNQQLIHNRSLFFIFYPFYYIWYLDDKLVYEKNNTLDN